MEKDGMKILRRKLSQEIARLEKAGCRMRTVEGMNTLIVKKKTLQEVVSLIDRISSGTGRGGEGDD